MPEQPLNFIGVHSSLNQPRSDYGTIPLSVIHARTVTPDNIQLEWPPTLVGLDKVNRYYCLGP
jgi:hypothetical protein